MTAAPSAQPRRRRWPRHPGAVRAALVVAILAAACGGPPDEPPSATGIARQQTPRAEHPTGAPVAETGTDLPIVAALQALDPDLPAPAPLPALDPDDAFDRGIARRDLLFVLDEWDHALASGNATVERLAGIAAMGHDFVQRGALPPGTDVLPRLLVDEIHLRVALAAARTAMDDSAITEAADELAAVIRERRTLRQALEAAERAEAGS